MQADGLETLDLHFFDFDEIPYAEISLWYRVMLEDVRRGNGPHFHPPVVQPPTKQQIESVRAIIDHEEYIGVGATAVIVRQDGRLLIARLRENEIWHFPGGFCDLGENAAATAVREALEETGLDVLPERILGVFSPTQSWQYPNGDRTQSLVTVFRCRLLGGKARPDGLEADRVAWATPQEVLDLPQHPYLSTLNHQILNHLERGSFVC
jgi:ADP-ribose pyrophosphatase YjhB (NUDIX family)